MHEAGPTVIGPRLANPRSRDARRRLGDEVVVQGNLDPALVLAGVQPALDGTDQVLRDNELADGTQHPGHIFNLGHGVNPETDPGVLQAVVDLVHERTTVTPMSAAGPDVAVLLMAYGTPRHADEIEPYYTDIRRGRPPTPEALADLTARYAAIGGVSPLAQLTEAQRVGLQPALDAAEPGRFHVALGLKHADPKVEVAAGRLADDGFDTIVGLVLAPHYSSYSVGQYLERTRQGVVDVGGSTSRWSASRAGRSSRPSSSSWPTISPPRVGAMRERTGGRVRVLFTAHSLPERIIAAGDPYPDELRSTAEAVAASVGLAEGDDWQIAWQSAGRTPEPWIGPDILAVIDELGDDADVAGVIVCACGFVADHLEVLYDLDIEAARRAAVARPGLRPHGMRQRRPDDHGSTRRRG